MEANLNRGMTENHSTVLVHEEMESLRSGFTRLRSDVAELFTHAFGLGRSGAEYAREYGSDALDNLKHRYADLRQRGAQRMETVEQKIQQRPLSAAIMAFGVGFIAARVLARRR